MKKKSILVLFVLSMFLLCACGKKEELDNTSWFPFGELIYLEGAVVGELGTVDSPLNAQEVYANLTYEPEMFYGSYRLSHPSDGKKDNYPSESFVEMCQWVQRDVITDSNPYLYEYSSMPYGMQSGTIYDANLSEKVFDLGDYNWCTLYYAKKDSEGEISYDTVLASYEIDGNQITYHILKDYVGDEYEFTDNYFTYEFKFEGPSLTLISSEMQVKMYNESFCYSQTLTEQFSVLDVSTWEGEEKIDNIETMSLNVSSTGNNAYVYVNEDGEIKEYKGVVQITEDGLMTFTYKDSFANPHTYQFVVFYCGLDGLIFTDGKTNYYYTCTSSSQSALKELESVK